MCDDHDYRVLCDGGEVEMLSLKRLLKSKDGHMTFLAVILLTVIIFIALFVYTGSMLYTNYYGAQHAMERSINSAVAEFLNGYEVKDVVAQVDPEAMKDLIADGMVDNGLTAHGDGYVLLKGDNVAYSITDVEISGTDEYVTISGTFEMNMPWGIAQGIVWETPISASSRLMFISRVE